MCTCVGNNDGFKRGRGVVARVRMIMLNVYAFFSNQTKAVGIHIFVTQTKAVYIVYDRRQRFFEAHLVLS